MKKELEKIFDWWKVDNLYDEGEDTNLEKWISDNFSGKLADTDDLRSLDYFLQEIYPVANKDICIWCDDGNVTFQVTGSIENSEYTVMYENDCRIPFNSLDTMVTWIEKINNYKL